MSEVFTPPEELSSAERISRINGYRDQVRSAEPDPSEDELKYAVELMRSERSFSAGRSAEKKEKGTTVKISLDDI